MVRVVALFVLSLTSLFGQSRVAPEMMYHRVWAIVPLVGKGTSDDPRRPMFAPSPAEKALSLKNGNRSGVLSYTMQLSDDRQHALVEFVGATPADLKFIVNSGVPGVVAFERGSATKAQIEAAFQQYKLGFTLNSFLGRTQ